MWGCRVQTRVRESLSRDFRLPLAISQLAIAAAASSPGPGRQRLLSPVRQGDRAMDTPKDRAMRFYGEQAEMARLIELERFW